MNRDLFPSLARARWVTVREWVGRAPAVGDQLRSRRGRYLIVALELEEQLQPGRETLRPRRLRVIRVTPGAVVGGREHAWTWDKRGRSKATPSLTRELKRARPLRG